MTTGGPPTVESAGPASPPAADRFFCDAMLGRLARALRLLGYDTSYERDIADAALIARCHGERRVLLTRDSRLLQRRSLPRYCFVADDRWQEQVRQVVNVFGLNAAHRFTRCLECNGRLMPVSRDDVFCRVPHFVYRTAERFLRCSSCGRIFWPGSHVQVMDYQIEHIMDMDR